MFRPTPVRWQRPARDEEGREGRAAAAPFGEVLRDLLLEQGYTTPIGNADWPRFARDLGDVKYETLSKAVTSERVASLIVLGGASDQRPYR